MKKITLILLLVILNITSSFSQAPATWTINPAAFNNSMQITCKLNENCIDLNNSNNIIAAFVGGQCRGVANSNVTVGSDHMAFLVIYSDVSSNEQITFQVYNDDSNHVYNVHDTIPFVSNTQIGGINNPRVITNNYPPTDMQLSSLTFLEGLTIGGTIGNLTATDNNVPNNFTYFLPAGILDNANYSISGNQLQANGLYDHESDSLDTIRVTVIDASFCTYTEDFILYINDQNDTPIDLAFAPQLVYDGNPAGTFVGKLSTIDPDPLDTHTYSLVTGLGGNDNAAFYVSNDSLFNVAAFSYATQNIFKFRARTTDFGGLFLEDTFTVNLINVNDPPICFNDSILTALLEDGTNGTVNIILNDTDLDGNPTAPTNITGQFVIDINNSLAGIQITNTDSTGVWSYNPSTGEVSFDPASNFYGVVSLTYQLCDSAGACDNAVVTFTVNPTNDPVIASNDSVTNHLSEDGANGTVNILLNDTDIDEGVIAPTNGISQFSIDIDATATGLQTTYTDATGIWSFDTLTGVLNFNPGVNYFGPASLSYTVCDDSSSCSNALVYFMVDSINDHPYDLIISHDTTSENLSVGTFVATLSSLDIELSDTHSYSLVSGTGSTHNSYFRISNDSLLSDSIFDYETLNSLQIRINTHDNFGANYQETFTINVIDRNDTPTDITLSGDSILEQSPANTIVGNFTSVDQDPSNTHSYALVTGLGDTDNNLFNISGNSIQSSQVFLYNNQTYSVRVRTTDNLGAFFEKIFSIRVININDTPTDIIIDTLTLKEDNASDFYLSKIRTVDVDTMDTFTYTLVSGSGDVNNNQFTIIDNDLYINGKTNFDVQNSYSIRVRSADNGGLFVEKEFIVQVTDIAGNSIPLPSVNYISPNGDGKNDFFAIDNVDIYKKFALSIYDQYGLVVYSLPENYQNDWDGKMSGSPLPTGNYYYIFKNDRITYKGNITIVNQD